SQHNLGYWLGHDYLGVGIGAVSTIEGQRWRNRPQLARYVAALAGGRTPVRDVEPLDGDGKARERGMLRRRLGQAPPAGGGAAAPLPLAGLGDALDADGLARVEKLGLAERTPSTLTLTERGRYLGGAVTAELLA